eukprot:Em0013g470a
MTLLLMASAVDGVKIGFSSDFNQLWNCKSLGLKLLSEIEDVLGDRKEVTGDDLDKLKYTEQVIQEVLRMYPTVIRMIKESPRGGLELSGYHIPEGASISFFTAVMSRNPAFFNDPDTFDPSRFDVDKPR